MQKSILYIWFVLLFFSACEKKETTISTRFEHLNAEETSVDFINRITETETVNYFTYPYLYMGGGVAIGDINNDGLQDLYFTSNMGENKLYLNITKQEENSPLQFGDITATAGVAGDKRWDTGVTFADVNSDGLMDIYVSVSGKWESTENQLFINNGDLTFSEKAEEYGLADAGNSTQATFFDYDGDGDLDAYIANYPPLDFKAPNFVYSQNLRNPRLQTSDHLYRNDGDIFTDVSEEAGVLNFGLALSATSGDFNRDGLIDIYVSNDFAAPDFLYLNNGDGTFRNETAAAFGHTAFYGMGTDAADFNNDGLLDIVQADMTPEDNFRSKANMASMNPAGFQEMIELGLTYQYMENALQINQGVDQKGLPRFGDISRMTGTALTDWSWSPLFADFDNDGLKDLHITNGTRRDINNKDYFKKIKNDTKSSDLEKSLAIPAQKVENYAFKNQGDLTFTKVGEDWGLNFKGYSNGSAYGDLDNDGDLDLVVNNTDDVASIFRNQSKTNNYLRLAFKDNEKNPFGLGCMVELFYEGKKQYAENTATRGFQSASESILHFGLGGRATIDTLKVTWTDGKRQILTDVSVNQLLTISYENAIELPEITDTNEPVFVEVLNSGADFKHQENVVNDFLKERLLPHATSRFGPALAAGDINGDDLEDFYIGGAKGQSPALFLQNLDGSFQENTFPDLIADKKQEDLGALFFDADGDGDNDLYVVSGGSEAEPNSDFYQDRLYLNQNGILVKSKDVLPQMTGSGSRVKACDFDADGDLDLLVGGRLVPQNYAQPASSVLLINETKNGKTVFQNATTERAPALENLGMVTDFVWTDFDADGDKDLVAVGEWMPVCFFENEDGKLTRINKETDSRGWWFSIAAADLNKDGREDLVLGNLGKNYKYQASKTEAFELYLSDYDHNEEKDIVLSYTHEGEKFPVRGRQCSSEQMPHIAKEFESYNAFAGADLEDIYTKKALSESEIHFSINSFASQIWLQNMNGSYLKKDLPQVCQISSVNSILITYADADGKQDLILGGNLFSSENETKRNDASIGQMLQGDGKGNFLPLDYAKSGLKINKDVKQMALLFTQKNKMLLVANNNDKLQIFKF